MRAQTRQVFQVLCVLVLLAFGSFAQSIERMTTPVDVYFTDHHNFGSGFFFQQLGPFPHPDQSTPQWRLIKKLYVVTAAHVVELEHLGNVTKFAFRFRAGGDTGSDWIEFSIPGKEFPSVLHLSPKRNVDVAVVDVTDYVNSQLLKLSAALPPGLSLQSFAAVSEDNFPGVSKLAVAAGDDVIVVGYPRQLYDRYNKLPILKLGLLNTPLGLRYDNLEGFLLDFRGYEGSSGSLVIGKPSNIAFDNEGRLMYSKDKEFVFLGVYSGQRYRKGRRPVTADLGLGWYYYNVQDAIDSPPGLLRSDESGN